MRSHQSVLLHPHQHVLPGTYGQRANQMAFARHRQPRPARRIPTAPYSPVARAVSRAGPSRFIVPRIYTNGICWRTLRTHREQRFIWITPPPTRRIFTVWPNRKRVALRLQCTNALCRSELQFQDGNAFWFETDFPTAALLLEGRVGKQFLDGALG